MRWRPGRPYGGCWVGLALVMLMTLGVGGHAWTEAVPVGAFSTMDPTRAIPTGWERISLAAAFEPTDYRLVEENQRVVVRARSRNTASSLGTEHRVDVTAHPVLAWAWKIDSIVEGANVATQARDDRPASLFVSFNYDDLDLLSRLRIVALRAMGYEVVPRRAIAYIWANQPDQDRVISGAYTPWVKQVAVQRGTTRVGTWQQQRRNVRADYRRLFGEAPPSVRGVAIMTDTDNTDGDVTAYYGDIRFRAPTADSTADK